MTSGKFYRCYDFQHRTDHFMEGELLNPSNDEGRMVFEMTRLVQFGEDAEFDEGEKFYSWPPGSMFWDWPDRVEEIS